MPTPFQKSVCKAMEKIPRGKVTTYGNLAKFLGTNAVRAVGTAVGKNPNAPTVPCHRVVRSDGKIGKYSGPDGVNGKIKILQSEGVEIKNGKIVNFAGIRYKFDN